MRLKQLLYLIANIFLVAVALVTSFLLRFGFGMSSSHVQALLVLTPLAILVKISVFYLSGFYGQLWQYASLKEAVRLFKGISMASLLLSGVFFVLQWSGIPRTILFIDWLLTLYLIGGSYFIIRVKRELLTNSATKAIVKTKDIERKRVVIVGAGEAGSMLTKQMQHHPERGYEPVAFLDDNPLKKGLMIHGVKVVGNTRIIPKVLADHPADEMILAIPSAAHQARRRIAFECKVIGIPCKTVPDIVELVDGKVSLSQIRGIDPKELLGRQEAEIDLKGIADLFAGCTILITGAAGSIGSELCRQIAISKPVKVIATDISENGLYHLEEEMFCWLDGDSEVFETHIMDVRDECAVERVFDLFKPEIVFHAAAYKHVPLMERHPVEALENNFLGTRVMVDAANRHNCERFVLVSTDKAVKPTSIMGLSKQLAEQAVRTASNGASDTKFMAVRFGNVLGSNGSVIPKFKRQINDRQAVTVTHPDITRYFMTIHEAVYLVIQAATMGKGGELFVLDMGEPVSILDLAYSMIRLSGFEPEKDIPIEFIGLRPGEKLCEELFAEEEVISTTSHPQIFEAFDNLNYTAGVELLNKLEILAKVGDTRALIDLINQKHSLYVTDEVAYLVKPRIDSLPKSEIS